MLINKHRELSSRAEKLLEFLLETPDKWVSQEEICFALPQYFRYKKNDTGTNVCPAIWHTINEINDSTNIEILINRRSYKIASREEAKEALKELWYKGIQPKIDRVNRLKHKLRIDGTADLTSLIDSETLAFLDNFVREQESVNGQRSIGVLHASYNG